MKESMANHRSKETAEQVAAARERYHQPSAERRSEETAVLGGQETKNGRQIVEQASVSRVFRILLKLKSVISEVSALSINTHGKTLVVPMTAQNYANHRSLDLVRMLISQYLAVVW